ncbi:MAG: hypothetical protein N3G18_09355 [Candidatus Saccharicenans sp.]|nr:hypothetical protein [Candidatus Saccharicenans sp.]
MSTEKAIVGHNPALETGLTTALINEELRDEDRVSHPTLVAKICHL